MYFSRKRPLEDFPNEETAIWSCTSEGCNGWMRDRFSFEEIPVCPHCKSPMKAGKKLLPILAASSHDLKALKKNAAAAANE